MLVTIYNTWLRLHAKNCISLLEPDPWHFQMHFMFRKVWTCHLIAQPSRACALPITAMPPAILDPGQLLRVANFLGLGGPKQQASASGSAAQPIRIGVLGASQASAAEKLDVAMGGGAYREFTKYTKGARGQQEGWQWR